MARLEASTLINKPAEDVFAFLNVAENHAKFIPGMVEFEKTSPGPFAQVGATARGARRDLGFRSNVRYEITEVEPNRKLGMQGTLGPVLFRDAYVLEAAGDKTRVKFWLELTLPGVMRLASPFLNFIGRTHAGETLANLKRTLEAAG